MRDEANKSPLFTGNEEEKDEKASLQYTLRESEWIDAAKVKETGESEQFKGEIMQTFGPKKGYELKEEGPNDLHSTARSKAFVVN